MKLDYHLIDGKIYDRQLNEIPPDEKGRVKIEVEGKERVYVLDILLRNISEGKVITRAKHLPEQKERAKRNSLTDEQRKLNKNAYMREFTARNRPKKDKPEKKVIRRNLGRTGVHRRKGLIAITPDGKELQFDSRADASRKLSIGRSGIFNVLRNKIPAVNGYKFKTA